MSTDRIALLGNSSHRLLRSLLLLLVVVLLLLVDVSSSSSSSSKRMSSKEWKLQREHAIAIPSSHNCIHDKVMGGSVPPVVHGVRHDTSYSKKHTNNDSNNSNERVGVRQIVQGDPIRMIIDTTYLNYSQDPDRLCNVVGQWAKAGFPGGTSSNPTPQCADEEDNNCWFRCTTEDVLSSDKLEFLQNKVIPDVKDFFESALHLDRVIGNLILTGSTCGCSSTPGVTMPSIYTTTGVAADIVIFLTARTTRFQGNTIAFACPCYDDAVTRRPIAGFINWGPNRISLDNPAYPEQLGVGIHEITHVLGFTSGKYAYYGSPTGSAVVTARVNLTSPGLAPKTVMVLTTPKVVEVAKEYYGCDSLVGVELEDGGSSGTTASHWERRLLMNEYMTGYSSYDPRKSVFTLALLEDTSWYYPNYSVADALYWGKDGGCDFVQKRCNSRVSPYNVATANDEGCIWDGKRKGRSNLVTYTSDLDPWDQYYSAPDIGGRDDLADFCGFLQYRKDYRGDCTLSEYNTPGDDYYLVENFGEWFCPSCQCISATDTNGASGGSCHNFTCANNKLMIKIANAWYECLENNYEIKVSDPFEEYVGKYYCPKDVQATCSAAPQDTAVWPTFDSVSPQSGGVNDEITITANNFGSQPVVYLGNYYGCVDSSIQVSGNQIKCTIGVREVAPTIRKNTKVDVIVQDTSGRTAVGVNAFELSASTQVLPSVVLLLVSAFLFL